MRNKILWSDEAKIEYSDPKHTATTTQEWLRDKSLNILEWPSHSLVLNPFEHLKMERPENISAAKLPTQPDRA
jgi:hypothetical protein